METTRRLFGFSFIAMAVWIAAPLLLEGVEPVLYATVVLVAAVDLLLRGRALIGFRLSEPRGLAARMRRKVHT